MAISLMQPLVMKQNTGNQAQDIMSRATASFGPSQDEGILLTKPHQLPQSGKRGNWQV
ncbi:hypothetical protein ACHMW4_29515 [Mesorhizobium sp. UC22_110]|uniref:hypothetical protein n=1 Tax=unclassified Mesorhizobium TaxID=325217 RepID=UPI00366A7190